MTTIYDTETKHRLPLDDFSRLQSNDSDVPVRAAPDSWVICTAAPILLTEGNHTTHF